MKSIKSAFVVRSRSRGSLVGKKLETLPPSSLPPPPSSTDAEDAAAAAAAVRTLESYRVEIEDLRRQLRESQEAQRGDAGGEQEGGKKETQIVELRRQLAEARGAPGSIRNERAGGSGGSEAKPSRLAGRRPGDGRRSPAGRSTSSAAAAAAAEAVRVENAVRYLDGVIQRFSNRSMGSVSVPQGRSRTSNTGCEETEPTPPRRRRQALASSLLPPRKSLNSGPAVEIILPSEFCRPHSPSGGVPMLVEVSSPPSCEDIACAGSSRDTSSATTNAPIDNEGPCAHSLCTAPSADDTSSWQPAGTMAALLAAAGAEDGTVGTSCTSDSAWATAAAAADGDGDDDLEDMQTCVSALTLPTATRGSADAKAGNGSGSAALASKEDDSAVIVAELYRIQSLLCSILKEKKEKDEEEQQDNDDADIDHGSSNIQCISSRAEIVARLWEKHLLADEEIRTTTTTVVPEDSSAHQHTCKQKRQKRQLEAERVIASLANLII